MWAFTTKHLFINSLSDWCKMAWNMTRRKTDAVVVIVVDVVYFFFARFWLVCVFSDYCFCLDREIVVPYVIVTSVVSSSTRASKRYSITTFLGILFHFNNLIVRLLRKERKKREYFFSVHSSNAHEAKYELNERTNTIFEMKQTLARK